MLKIVFYLVMHGSHAVLVGAQVATVLLYPSRDTFEFDQGHVTKNQPIKMQQVMQYITIWNDLPVVPSCTCNLLDLS